MKTIDELLIAWRDESITADELKQLEQMLADAGARERLFEEFLMTATIAEALKADSASRPARLDAQPGKSTRSPVLRYWLATAAAAVVLLVAVAVYRYSTSAPREFQIVSGSAVVDQKKDGQAAENSLVTCDSSSSATIRFPDGLTMELEPSSSSVLLHRGVDLKTGKANFQIQPAQTAAEAFSVNTVAGRVTGQSTKFSVELQPKTHTTPGGTNVNRAAFILAVSVLAGSVSVDFDGTSYALAMGQSRAFGDDKAAPKLPDALKGFDGGINGQIVSVDKDSIVVKLGPSSKKQIADLKGTDVVLIVKNVKDLPELKVDDQVYGKATEVEGQLVAKTLFKAPSK